MITKTPIATSQAKAEPIYRKKLNNKQVEVLQLLVRFRFARSEQIAWFQAKPGSKGVQKRLKILEDQGLIAKRYDKHYKLQGKPAAYYITPQGARTLVVYKPRSPNEPVNIKRLYKNKDVSENFIEHCKNVLDVYLALKAQYPVYGTITYFTKSQLNYEQYDFLPSPLHDALIHLKTRKREQYFFMDIFEDNQPFFVLIRRIKNYLDYIGSGEWEQHDESGTLPTILFVVQNKSVHKRLRKRIAYELRQSYEKLSFATSRLENVLDTSHSGNVWFPIDMDGDDSDEPIEATVLHRLPTDT